MRVDELPKGVTSLRQQRRNDDPPPTLKPFFIRNTFGPSSKERFEDIVIWQTSAALAHRDAIQHHGINGESALYQLRVFAIDENHPMAKEARPKRRGRPKGSRTEPELKPLSGSTPAPIVNQETGEQVTV